MHHIRRKKYEKKIKRLCGLFICCCVVVTSSVTAFAAEKDKEPFANLDQNEVFADLEIITDQNEIEKIWEENPDVKTLMKSKEYYYLAYVKGNGVRLRNTPSTSGVINGLLCETRKDWVLLNDNYSLNENYIWWQVSDSSIGCPGWIVNDYIYLSAAKSAGRAVTVPEIDFDTLKFVQ